LKKDIRKFREGINVVEKINPVVFKWNGLWDTTNDDVVHIGVIAQELESLAPYAVVKGRGKLFEEAEEGDINLVDNSSILFLLVNAVKEVNGRINKLKEAVEKYKTEENLDSLIKDLELL